MGGSIPSTFLLLGGIGLFLHGLTYSTEAFRKVLGKQREALLGSFLRHRGLSFVTGAFFSALAQSSTAATSFVVGLVSAGLLPLQSAMIVMIGASVGTTFVTFILALHVVQWAPLGLGISAFLLRSSRSSLQKWGALGLGISLILTGMLFIQQGVVPLSSSPALASLLLTLGKSPLLSGLLAFGMAGILQSSVPVIGLSMALVSSGLLPLESVFFLVLGSHGGTTVMVLFAGMGTKKNARTLAWSNLLYKMGGVLVLLPLYKILPSWGARFFATPEGSIAFIQIVLIWGNALLFLPLARPLARGGTFLAGLFGREDPGEPLYLEFPPPPFSNLALSLLSKEMVRGANLMEECLFRTLRRFRTSGDRERLELLPRSTEELIESCTEYLLALPPPGEAGSGAPEEYACLAHSLGCMREMKNLLLRNFLPQHQRWRELSQGSSSSQKEEWEALEEQLLLLVNESFGSFALGDPKPSRRFLQEYRELTASLEELQRSLETTRGLFHAPENLQLWELCHTLRSMAQRSFCLAQGCSVGEINSYLAPPERDSTSRTVKNT